MYVLLVYHYNLRKHHVGVIVTVYCFWFFQYSLHSPFQSINDFKKHFKLEKPCSANPFSSIFSKWALYYHIRGYNIAFGIKHSFETLKLFGCTFCWYQELKMTKLTMCYPLFRAGHKRRGLSFFCKYQVVKKDSE